MGAGARRWWRSALVAMVSAAAACHSTALPEGSGRGLVSADETAPSGVETVPRPTWRVGDRFVYRRGALVRTSFSVIEAGADGYTLVNDETGARAHYTADLGELGEEAADDPLDRRVEDPADVLFHWPLWLGKKWSCHFLRKVPGQGALPLLVSCECDAVETIHVPAGEFQCWRVLRRVRVAANGSFLERVALLWYSPKVGFFVRRLENGTMLELEEFHRQ